MNSHYACSQGPIDDYQRAKTGDQEALARITDAVSSGIALVLRRHLEGGPTAAQTLAVQDAVRSEIRQMFLAGYPEPDFVARIAREVMLDHVRRWREADSLSRHTSPRPAPEVRALRGLLDELSVREREALRRYYVEGEPENLICAALLLSGESFRTLRTLVRECFRAAGIDIPFPAPSITHRTAA